MMQKVGEISELKRQVEFILVPSQSFRKPHEKLTKQGKLMKVNGERAIKYVADFTYIENGELVCEDVKGMKTREYIMKRKLMLFIHGIEIRET